MRNKHLIDADCDLVLKSVGDLSKLRNKSVLVTGASGLVGIYIVNSLVKLKTELNLSIFCCVKTPPTKEFETLFHECNLIVSDITQLEIIDSLPNFDYIIHSAGYGQPLKFLEDEITTIKLNTTTTFSLFEKLKPNGCFLFISSTEVYSGLDCADVDESCIGSTNTDHPRCCYIEGKRTGEAICHIYSRQGYDVKIARLGHTYGPGTKKNDKRVLNTLVRKGLTEPTITLMDDGSAVRTFCYIRDVTEMLLNILLYGKSVTYNIGGVDELSIYELACKIGSITGKSVERSSPDMTLVGNPKIVNVSTNKYCAEFSKSRDGFVGMEEGLKNTLKWQEQFYI